MDRERGQPLLFVSAFVAFVFLATAPGDSYAAGSRYSSSWAVEVRGGSAMADALAHKYGFANHGQIGNLEGYYHFGLVLPVNRSENETVEQKSINPISQTELRSDLTQAFQSEENVGYVEQQKIRKLSKKEYTPPTDPLWHNQWSLLNTGQTSGSSGLDINVEPVWMQGYTGSGVVVGFVDDGLEHAHPDLSPNYDSAASWDFVHRDGDPTPDKYSGDEPDSHGTSCAGEVGMAKNNGRCGVGVAYNSRIGGLKLDLSQSTDLTEASALGYKNDYIHIYSNSWGPTDWGFTVGGPGRLVTSALATGVREGRNRKGSIYVWAAGNGGRYYDSCAADGYSSSIYTISVGSADQSAHAANYDEQCAAKMVVTFNYNSLTAPAPDEDWTPYDQITTTTLNGRCTDGFDGTSAAAPLVSGVMALALQANPELTWRDVQYLIAYTSNPAILSGGNWVTNGAGLRVSHQFGFGALDAEALVTRARHWISVPEQHSRTVYGSRTSGTINSQQSLIVNFQVSQTAATNIHFLEHVVVTTSLTVHGYVTGYESSDFYNELYYNTEDIDEVYQWMANSHPRRGDIRITLTSPQGTESVLLPYRNYDFVNEEGYDNWPFMSVHHWGENPAGQWTLSINFLSSSGYVSMNGLKLTLYGTAVTPQAVQNIPTHCSTQCSRGCSGSTSQDCDACTNLRIASTLDCVSECPNGVHEYHSYCFDGEPTATPSSLSDSSSSPQIGFTDVHTTPSDTTPSDTAPSDTTPSDTAPSDTTPSHTAPSVKAPSDTTPSDAAPSATTTSPLSDLHSTTLTVFSDVLTTTSGSNSTSFSDSHSPGSNDGSSSHVAIIAGSVASIGTVLIICIVSLLCISQYIRYRKRRCRGGRFSFVPLEDPVRPTTI